MILVTGSAGFIGRNTIKSFETRAIGLQRVEDGAKYRKIICDLTDPLCATKVVKQLGGQNITHIIHAAGITPWSNKPDYSLDLVMAETVVQLCQELNVRQLIYMSGWNVYDMRSGGAPFSELTPLRPMGGYGESKLATERLLSDKLGATRATHVRLASIYGVGQTSPGLIPNFVSEALTSHRITLKSIGTRRDYLNIDDLVRAIKQLVEYDSDELPLTLNIGSGSSISVHGVAITIQRWCKDAYGLNVEIDRTQAVREAEPIDNELAVHEAQKLGLITSTTEFETGIAEYIEWRKNENIL